MNADDKAIELGAGRLEHVTNWNYAHGLTPENAAKFIQWLNLHGEDRGQYPMEDGTVRVKYR